MAYGKLFPIVNQSVECCLCSKLRSINQCIEIKTIYGDFGVCNECSYRLIELDVIDPHSYAINELACMQMCRYIESILND